MEPQMTPPPGMLSCSVCSEVKSTNNFSPRKDRPRGFHYLCKACQTIRSQLSRLKNDNEEKREKARRKSQEWRREKPSHRNFLKACYKAAKKQAQPKWLTQKQKYAMIEFYELASYLKTKDRQSYHVDHIVPLRGRDVCGLHVPWNLQVLPPELNRKKSNSYEY